MKSANSTPSSTQKSKRSHLGEFLPLYKKYEESKVELKSSETNEVPDSKSISGTPKHRLSSKKQEKNVMEVSVINIDGVSLNPSGGNTTPLNESSTVSRKKSSERNKKLKKTPSADSKPEANESVSSNSQKRSKSASFLVDKNEQAEVKKSKLDDTQSNVNSPKKKKSKKLSKSEKENKEEIKAVPTIEVFKSNPEPAHSVSDGNVNEKGDELLNNTGIKKKRNKGLKNNLRESDQVQEKTRKAKKQKHQHTPTEEGEPIPKSPKTEFLDNLENLNLGDNTHTLTTLIDEMAVVDKAKKIKQRKTANREKQNEAKPDIVKEMSDTEDEKQEPTETEAEKEKKKWDAKRWNKQKLADRDQSITANVDNLPVSLLKGNYKKVLIDHFSKNGKKINVGEPRIQNENDQNPVFSTKLYFESAEAKEEALEMDNSVLSGNQIRVSAMRPMTDTVLVIRIYGVTEKLTEKEILDEYGQMGLIRSVKGFLQKKKTMATTFVEFDGPEEVDRALQKSANVTIRGKKVMANRFTVRIRTQDSEPAKTTEKKKKRKRGPKKAHGGNKNVKSEN